VGCGCSKEYHKDRNGALRSSKEEVETGRSGNNFIYSNWRIQVEVAKVYILVKYKAGFHLF